MSRLAILPRVPPDCPRQPSSSFLRYAAQDRAHAAGGCDASAVRRIALRRRPRRNCSSRSSR